jgi:hypothetical protein
MKITQNNYTIQTTLRDPDFFHSNYYWSLTVGHTTDKRILLEEQYPVTFREEEILSIGLSFAHDL